MFDFQPQVGGCNYYFFVSYRHCFSCIPNCIFTNDGSVTTYRAIRPIQKGEEMCVAYVDLYQSR